MDQIVSQFRDEISKRVRHPFLVSFFLALVSVNYKIFFVLASGDGYQVKFNYIENVLYPCYWDVLLGFFCWPLVSAMFFVFVWPLVDTEISAIAIRLDNRRKLKLLLDSRREPIDKDEQAQYFEKNDREISEIKSRLAITYGRESKLLKEGAQKISNLTERIKRQAILRLADSAEVSEVEVRNVFDFESWVLRDHHKELLESAKKIKQIPKMVSVVEAIEAVPLTDDYRKIGDVDWLVQLIGGTREYAVDFHCILYALGIFGDYIDGGQSFEIIHHNTKMINRIRSLPEIL